MHRLFLARFGGLTQLYRQRKLTLVEICVMINQGRYFNSQKNMRGVSNTLGE